MCLQFMDGEDKVGKSLKCVAELIKDFILQCSHQFDATLWDGYISPSSYSGIAICIMQLDVLALLIQM